MEEQNKANGLHSGTCFQKFDYPNGLYTQEWHEHPETGELIILDTWYEPDGQDDVTPEFEVIKVFPKVGCELAKVNKERNKIWYEGYNLIDELNKLEEEIHKYEDSGSIKSTMENKYND